MSNEAQFEAELKMLPERKRSKYKKVHSRSLIWFVSLLSRLSRLLNTVPVLYFLCII